MTRHGKILRQQFAYQKVASSSRLGILNMRACASLLTGEGQWPGKVELWGIGKVGGPVVAAPGCRACRSSGPA